MGQHWTETRLRRRGLIRSRDNSDGKRRRNNSRLYKALLHGKEKRYNIMEKPSRRTGEGDAYIRDGWQLRMIRNSSILENRIGRNVALEDVLEDL